MDTLPRWAELTALFGVVGLMAVIGLVWLYLRSKRPKPAFVTKHGLHVYHHMWRQADTRSPLPTQGDIERWWEELRPRVWKVFHNRLHVANPNMSISRLQLIWRPGTRTARNSLGIPIPDKRGKTFYFED